MAKFIRNYRLGTSLAAVALAACTAPAFAQSSADGENDVPEADIVVTGVFGAKAIEDAPISVSSVTAAELAQQIPNSAADLIKNVPGVYVNSSLGEIRNVVFSRGVSANSLDGDGGYYYVSLQEDGLPIEPVLVSNFGPDYFARPDIMLGRLEGLRGGTATVTGANAPGGIFNYISRNGRSNPGFEFQGKFGLEGDGRNPYYRADAYAGGALGDNLYYAIGGFYRKSDGARDPGYAINKGGQLRANLLWDYGAGSVTIDGKYLNDHNGWFEFIPARNFASPKLEAPFNTYSSVLPPRNPHSFTNPDGTTGSWDGADLVHSKALSFGMTWEHELSDKIKLQNKMRWSENKSNWSTGAVIFALPLDDFFVSLLSGTFGPQYPGVTTYRFRGTSDIAAQVTSFSGFDHTVTTNNLPNQSVQANGVFSQVALSQAYKSRTFQDQFTATGDFGNHEVAVGAFYSRSR
jgi:outer membrane receptor protein involved in Fe transport